MLKFVSMVDKGLANVEKPVMFIFGTLLFGIMCFVVFARFILHIPTAYQTELTKFFHIWMCFVGASYLIGVNGHPAVELFSDKVKENASPIVRKLYFTVIYLVILAFVGTAFWFAMSQWKLYARQVTTYLSISYIWVNGGAILGLFMMSLRCLIKLIYIWGGDEQ